jgi:arabinan endo-1,5-alpha-L-arabinosidase
VDTKVYDLSNQNSTIFSAWGISILGVAAALLIVTSADGRVPALGAWLFDADEGEGVVTDATGNGNEGEVTDVLWSPEGKFGGALEFDGVKGSVLFNGDQEPPEHAFILHQKTDATVTWWIYNRLAQHRAIFWTREDDVDAARFNIVTDPGPEFGWDYRANDGTMHATGVRTKLPLKEWTHLAIVREGKRYRLYKNGELQGMSIDPKPDLPGTSAWQISGRGGFTLDGLIDELAFYGRALTQEEIADIKTRGLELAALYVSPHGKLVMTWGRLKNR